MITIKNNEQIEGIRQSCQLAAKCLEMLKQYVVPGETTEYLNQIAEYFIRDHKATPAPLGYRGFPKAICTSINEVICHGIPDGYRLKEGDIINLDITTILDGYYGDTSAMFAVGQISAEAQNLIEVTRKSLDLGIRQVVPGGHFSDIGFAITTYAQSHGYSVVHQFCGHGVGLEFHEPPNVQHFATKRGLGPKFVPGMIFTIEPMLNCGVAEAVIAEDGWTARTKDGKMSAQFEHTILVTEGEAEILTLAG